MATSLQIDELDMQGVPHVVDVSSKAEAEDLLAGRPFGTFCVWRLRKFAILTYQDPGCKEVAHSVIEKSLEGLFRIRNNSKQQGFATLRELLASRKYLKPELPIDDINIVTDDGTASSSAAPRHRTSADDDAAREARRARMPLRLPNSGVRKDYAEEERLRMVSELWEEEKPLPHYTNMAWGKVVWWTCFVLAVTGTVFAAAFAAPYVQHHEAARITMTRLYTETRDALEERVGHIGEEGDWDVSEAECKQVVSDWRGRLEALETKLMHDFDVSDVSNALRHTVFSMLLAWGCMALWFSCGEPGGKLRHMYAVFHVLRGVTFLVAVGVTVLSLQFVVMCSETTQLLHMIPWWLRQVHAVDPGCAAIVAATNVWLHTAPPHLWVHLPLGLPQAPVPATRDVPFVVMVFGIFITTASLLGFASRYYFHRYWEGLKAAKLKKEK